MSDDTSDGKPGDQAHTVHDTSGDRFRANHPGDQFSGASGVLFERAMAQTRMAICLTDPKQDDNPIVFANRAFRALTGYEEEEIIGRNCRFLQGPQTDEEPLQQIRNAIAEEDVVVVELLNYRKDGTTFWNALHLGPIYDDKGELVYFFGSQWDVSDVRAARSEEKHARAMARELSHRMKNMFSVISGIVNITGRVHGVEKEAREINQRIQALGRAYETTLDEASSGSIALGPAIKAMLQPFAEKHELEYDGNGLAVSFAAVSTIGLILQELAENAAHHGAWSSEDGTVRLDWRKAESGAGVELRWTESGGPNLDGSEVTPGAGAYIIERLLRTCGGSIEREWRKDGLDVVVKLDA